MPNLTGRSVFPKGLNRNRKDRIKKTTHWASEYGTDPEFQAFVRTLPSAISGRMPCVFAHYRHAGNAGVGTKPEFSGIPLTFEEHAEQHRIGQFNFLPREEWERLVDKYLKMWIRSLRP